MALGAATNLEVAALGARAGFTAALEAPLDGLSRGVPCDHLDRVWRRSR